MGALLVLHCTGAARNSIRAVAAFDCKNINRKSSFQMTCRVYHLMMMRVVCGNGGDRTSDK